MPTSAATQTRLSNHRDWWASPITAAPVRLTYTSQMLTPGGSHVVPLSLTIALGSDDVGASPDRKTVFGVLYLFSAWRVGAIS